MYEHDGEHSCRTWYRDTASGRTFCVTGVDTRDDLIEVRHAGGDIERIELGRWIALDLELARSPGAAHSDAEGRIMASERRG